MRTPLPLEMTFGFLIQLVFCKKKKTVWFIGVEVEQETSAPPPKRNPGSAPALTIGQITVQWISIKEANCVTLCIDSNLSSR